MVSYSQGIQKMKRDSNEIISIMDISCTYENIYVFISRWFRSVVGMGTVFFVF